MPDALLLACWVEPPAARRPEPDDNKMLEFRQRLRAQSEDATAVVSVVVRRADNVASRLDKAANRKHGHGQS